MTFFVLSEAAIACTMQSREYYWNGDELISRSQSIVLAIAVNPEVEIIGIPGKTQWKRTRLTLRIIEVLRGESPEARQVEIIGQHYSNHFNDHADPEFWNKNMGRSPFYPSACGAVHSFVEGETYLIFLDAMKAAKSAEIIKRSDDKWLVYVRQSLSEQKRNRVIIGALLTVAIAALLLTIFARRRTTSGI